MPDAPNVFIARQEDRISNCAIPGEGNHVGDDERIYALLFTYPKVTVFCVTRTCRNNVGNWPVREIAVAPGARGFEFYSTKDRAMAEVATHGLMLWDGKSKGTLANILNLTRDQKPVVVYISASKAVHTLRNENDLAELLKVSKLPARPSVATLFNPAG